MSKPSSGHDTPGTYGVFRHQTTPRLGRTAAPDLSSVERSRRARPTRRVASRNGSSTVWSLVAGGAVASVLCCSLSWLGETDGWGSSPGGRGRILDPPRLAAQHVLHLGSPHAPTESPTSRAARTRPAYTACRDTKRPLDLTSHQCHVGHTIGESRHARQVRRVSPPNDLSTPPVYAVTDAFGGRPRPPGGRVRLLGPLPRPRPVRTQPRCRR